MTAGIFRDADGRRYQTLENGERVYLDRPEVSNGNGQVHGLDELSEESTTWEPVDLTAILAGDYEPVVPVLLARTDGQNLLYPGKVHSFAGEPESGKTWAALLAAAESLSNGLCVLYIDFEDTAETIVPRLLDLGVPVAQIAANFVYVRPDLALTLEARDVVAAILVQRRPVLAVVDGVTEAMALAGLNPYDNGDVAKWWAQLPRWLARAGCTVVLIDHVTKDKETRGRWAIGAQHKTAAIDGAVFLFEVTRPFGRGIEGRARILIGKDRPGYLRRASAGQVVGELVIRSWPDERIDADITAPTTASSGTFRPTVLMERISRYVEDHPGLSKNSVTTAVSGDDKAKRLGIELLVAELYLDLVKISSAHTLTSLRPYREEEETS